MNRFLALLLSFVVLGISACGTKKEPSTSGTVVIPVASTGGTSGSETTPTSTSTTVLTTTDTTGETIKNPLNTTTTKPITTTTTTTTTVTTTTKKPSTQTSGEFRATWVSYIELDKLLQSCKTVDQAKKAIAGIFDTAVKFKLNTVFFHVRANSDAYYKSSYFKPAATAKKLLDAGFDPLAYAVQIAHQRGISLHAWVNPYRAGKNTTYLVNGIPTFSDKDKRYYYVPTSSKAQQLILNGIRELVNNYAIDGIQYDDYFYPSDVLEENTIYSYENVDYEAYKKSGGQLSIANWRRAAVDSLISATHTITQAKGRIFGVSPAVNADNTYKKLYADPKKWMAESGYIDYICPQIYTGFEHQGSPFDKMTDTWLSYKRHASVTLYVGLANYKAGLSSDPYAGTGKTEWATHNDVLKRSVLYLRSKKIPGFAFYSYSYLNDNAESNNLLTVL